jgi:predicted AAA+ superfamily ATPase
MVKMEAELYKQNPWWEGVFKEESIERKEYTDAIFENLKTREVIFLTGLRRIGKTTILMQAISKLLKTTKPKDILFVSLDAFNLLEYSIHDIIDEYRKIHKKPIRDFFYLFLDEVTARDNFEQELKSIYDNENIKVICSSSIATLMRDKRALLTGRTKTIEVMPLTFTEFLQFKKAVIPKSDKHLIEAHFKDYLRIGGVPHYVLTEDKDYLNELVQNIVYKDIIAYHNITNEKAVKEMFVLLCERVGKVMSYSKLARMLHLSVDTAKRFVGYFEKAYLFYVVDKYAGSYNERVTAPKKIYCGDVGIKNMITGFRDLGASYENLVFLRIKHLDPNYYSENLTEIDFITEDSAVEAKYGGELTAKQKKAFDAIKKKNKTVARGSEFFM